MRIYKVDADFKRYDSCSVDYDACAQEHEFGKNELLFRFDGTSKADGWWPRIMVRNFDSPKKKLGDYINKISSDVIILEKNALEKIRHIMGNVEVLPLACDFGDYWAINVLAVLDCIDYDNSEYVTFDNSFINGRLRVMNFKKYVFREDVVRGHHMFKIIDTPRSAIFVDEVFVNAVKEHKITGFEFELVWEQP